MEKLVRSGWLVGLGLSLAASLGACGDDGPDGDQPPDAMIPPDDGGRPRADASIEPDGGMVTPPVEGFSDWLPVASTGELDATDLGSRIVYVSAAAGDDATGAFYYWNGTEVVDAEGNSYGSDPFEPEGDIRAFATFDRTAHLRDTVGEVRVSDWVLFRRGESYPPSGRMPPVGRSPEEPALIGAWGPLGEPRPKFDPNGESFWWQSNGRLLIANVVVSSVEVDARGAAPDERGRAIGALQVINDINLPPPGEPAPMSWLWFEDVRVRGRRQGVECMQWVRCTVNRSVVTDMWNPDAHVQGTFIGGHQVEFHAIDSIYYRNGYKEDPATNADPQRTIFDRNFYFGGGAQMGAHLDGVLSAFGGSGGPQVRYGGTVEDSLIIEGYWYVSTTSNGTAAEWVTGATGSSFDVHDNVQLLYKYDTPVEPGTRDARTHPGDGFRVGGASFGGSFERNIISGQLLTDLGIGETWNRAAIELRGTPVEATGDIPHDNTIRGNIVYALPAFGFGNAWDPAVSGYVVEDNVWIDRGDTDAIGGSAFALGDAVDFSGNRFYTDAANAFQTMGLPEWLASSAVTESSPNTVAPRADAEAAEGFPAPDRTLRTYCEDVLGLTITSPTGLPEFMERATEMRRGDWDERYTARAVVNYIREGFGMEPL